MNVTDRAVTRGVKYATDGGLILGLDPGGTTGFVVVDVEGGVVQAGSFTFGEWAVLEELISQPALSAVVVERFALYGNKAGALVGDEMVPAQVIGVVRFLLSGYRLKDGGRNPVEIPLVFQPASAIHSSARRLSPYAARLVADKGVGLDRHARDALAHVLVYLGRQRRAAA